MSGQPSFSVIIPTYQRCGAACDAVRALADIDYEGAVEAIVVVDGSTDDTAAGLRQLRTPLPLRVIEQANGGAAAARNRGAAQASGDILLFLDDDMLCEPDVLKQHARTLAAGADAVIGAFPVDSASAYGFLTETIAGMAHWDRSGVELTAFEVFTGHLSVRRSVFEAVGGFDERFTAGGSYGNEDIDFGARLLPKYDVRYNPDALVRQRRSVGPREYMRRAGRLAKSDLMFAAKHPALAAKLFERRGAGRISPRLRLLSRIPLVPRLLGAVTAVAAEAALKTPFRSSKKLSYAYFGAWRVAYWAALARR